MKFCRQWRRTEHLGSFDHIALLMPGPIGGVQEPDGEPHVLIDPYVGDGAISAPLLK
jgi:hypothetical protein